MRRIGGIRYILCHCWANVCAHFVHLHFMLEYIFWLQYVMHFSVFYYTCTLTKYPRSTVKHSEENCCVCDLFLDHILRNLHYKNWKLLFSVSDKTLIYYTYNYSKCTTLNCDIYCERQTDIWTLSADTWLGLTYFSILELFVHGNITNFSL